MPEATVIKKYLECVIKLSTPLILFPAPVAKVFVGHSFVQAELCVDLKPRGRGVPKAVNGDENEIVPWAGHTFQFLHGLMTLWLQGSERHSAAEVIFIGLEFEGFLEREPCVRYILNPALNEVYAVPIQQSTAFRKLHGSATPDHGEESVQLL